MDKFKDFLGKISIASRGELAGKWRPELCFVGEPSDSPGCGYLVVFPPETEQEWCARLGVTWKGT